MIGGGLLGLEAARGLLAHGVDVTVIETAPYLMPRQLDVTAGLMLARQWRRWASGQARASARRIEGEGRGPGASPERRHPAGGRPGRRRLRHSSPNGDEAGSPGCSSNAASSWTGAADQRPERLAVGECGQYNGECIGLVEPVYEQARVAAA